MSRTKTRTAVTAAVFIASSTGAALAGTNIPTILWDEAIDGDLPDLYNAGTTSGSTDFGDWQSLTVNAPGQYAITGQASEQRINSAYNIDGDAFALTIPEGMTLESLEIDHNQSLGIREFFSLTPDGLAIDQIFVARGFPNNVIFNTGLHTPATTDLLPLAGAALGPGTYILSFENALRFNNEVIMDYTIRADVTPTPGPIAIIALAGFAASRRRRA